MSNPYLASKRNHLRFVRPADTYLWVGEGDKVFPKAETTVGNLEAHDLLLNISIDRLTIMPPILPAWSPLQCS